MTCPMTPIPTARERIAGSIRDALMYHGIKSEFREDAIERATETILSDRAGEGGGTWTGSVADFVLHGLNCRDCADQDGVCPSSGLPCASARKAVEYVLERLNYGVNKGFLPPQAPNAIFTPSPTGFTEEEVKTALTTAFRRAGGIPSLARSEGGAAKIIEIAAREVATLAPHPSREEPDGPT